MKGGTARGAAVAGAYDGHTIKNVLRGFGGVGAAQDDCNSEFPYLDNSPLSYVPPAVERIIALYSFIFFH
jgi:hypothetical protein